MKKIIALVLALVMTAALFCVPAFAADSITDVVEVEVPAGVSTTPSAAEEEVTAEEIAAAVEAALASESEVKAELEALGIKAEALKVIDQEEVKGEMSEEAPVKAVITVNGVDEGTPVVILFKAAAEDAQWVVLGTGKAPAVEVEFIAAGTFAVLIA